MNVFLTGASGFLGQVVLHRLCREGHHVIALSRSIESDKVIEKIGGRAIRGELSKINKICDSLKNTDIVVHCAAPVEFWGPWSKFESGIVNATSNLARLSEELGVKRFIHVSSESVLQDKAPLLDVDESEPYPDVPNSYYGTAKKLAEEFLLSSDFMMEVLIIRPTFIWGPGSNAFTTIASKVKSGQFIWISNGKADFEAVHVENVAEAIIRAITRGKNKSVYFITDDEPTTVKEFFSNVFESLELPMPSKSIPTWIANPMARVIERAWKIMGLSSSPPLTRFDLSFVNMPRRYNISKAKGELGYKPIVTRKNGFASLQRKA